MKKRETGKLDLNRETLRLLAEFELDGLRGGWGFTETGVGDTCVGCSPPTHTE